MAGGFGGGGAEDAAKEMEEGARRANAEYQKYAQQGMDYAKGNYGQGRTDVTDYYNKGQSYLDPYLKGGGDAFNQYLAGLGLGGQTANDFYNQYTQTPAYQAALKEGQKAAERSSAARGMTQSGAMQKELMRYGQDYASGQYGQYMDRLAGLAGMGANMANQSSQNALGTGQYLGGLGQNYAQIVANLYGGMGTSAANAEMAAANARASAAANSSNPLAGIGQIAGGIIGGIYGGPMGAAAGSQAGGALGGALGK